MTIGQNRSQTAISPLALVDVAKNSTNLHVDGMR